MAAKQKKLSKKYHSRPEDYPNHKFFEIERLGQALLDQGIPADQVQQALFKYVEEEKEKCIADPVYFANNYGFIIGHGSSGLIPMDTAAYQNEILNSVRNNKYTICVKSRQLGVSTIMVFYVLWYSIFSNGKRTLIVAHNREAAEEFITKLKTAYEFLPEWMKPSCTLYSKNTVEFSETKCKIKAITSNPHAARSFSATLFVLDEAAFIEKADEVVKGLLPTIAAADAKLIALSSPNGNSDNNWFYKTFTLAKAGVNGWEWKEFPWTVSPIFTKNPKFKEDQIRTDNGNTDKFAQEYECRFDVNLASLFSQKALQAFIPSDKILNRVYGGLTYEDTFWIWKVAEQGKRYVMGIDCSANKPSSRDSSAFIVLDEDTQEQVAEYVGKLPTEVFADIVLKSARHYNNALMIPEENSYSDMLVYLLENKGYNNFWYADGKSKPGFNTNRYSRVTLIEKLVLFYNNCFGMSKLRSPRLKIQLENFSAKTLYDDGTKKYEANKGNDDLALALALALIPLTPKDISHRPVENIGIAVDSKNITDSSEYPEEYLEYYSKEMGISKSSLAHRLKLYHDIKQGKYDGSGLEEVDLKHPVEEYEKQLSVSDFLGTDNINIASDESINLITISRAVIPTDDGYIIDDIFDEKFSSILRGHQNYLYGQIGSHWKF